MPDQGGRLLELYPRRRPCGVAINTLVDLNKLAGETPSFVLVCVSEAPSPACRLSPLPGREPHLNCGRHPPPFRRCLWRCHCFQLPPPVSTSLSACRSAPQARRDNPPRAVRRAALPPPRRAPRGSASSAPLALAALLATCRQACRRLL